MPKNAKKMPNNAKIIPTSEYPNIIKTNCAKKRIIMALKKANLILLNFSEKIIIGIISKNEKNKTGK